MNNLHQLSISKMPGLLYFQVVVKDDGEEDEDDGDVGVYFFYAYGNSWILNETYYTVNIADISGRIRAPHKCQISKTRTIYDFN